MYKSLIPFIFLLVLAPTALAKQSFTYELHNQSGKWQQRTMLLLNPVSDLMIDIRKNIGGADLQTYAGWNLALGENWFIQTYLGIAWDDSKDLAPVYVQPEFFLFTKYGIFWNLFIPSYSLAIKEDRRKSTFYVQEKFWLRLGKFSPGFLTDILWFASSSFDLLMWRLGPSLSYAASRQLSISLWLGYETKTEDIFFRIGANLRF